MARIRLWKIGSLEHNVYPTEDAIQRLADGIQSLNSDGGGDLIWGPDLTVEAVDGDLDLIIEQLENGEQRITRIEGD